jgi:hypothetical protein
MSSDVGTSHQPTALIPKFNAFASRTTAVTIKLPNPIYHSNVCPGHWYPSIPHFFFDEMRLLSNLLMRARSSASLKELSSEMVFVEVLGLAPMLAPMDL